MCNRYIMKLQAPVTLEGSIDICSLAVDPPPSSPLNPNDAHCMEVMPTTWKREGREKKSPFSLHLTLPGCLCLLLVIWTLTKSKEQVGLISSELTSSVHTTNENPVHKVLCLSSLDEVTVPAAPQSP